MVIEELKTILTYYGFEVENDGSYKINGVSFNYLQNRETLFIYLPQLCDLTKKEKKELETIKFPNLKLGLTSKNLVDRLHASFSLRKQYLKIYNNIRLARIESNLKLKSELQVFMSNGFSIYYYDSKFDVENMNLERRYFEFNIETSEIKFRYNYNSKSICKVELSASMKQIFEIQNILKENNDNKELAD